MSDTPSFLTSQGEREERWNFYKLAIKERNFERLKCDRLERELAAAIAQRDKLAEALKYVIDNISTDSWATTGIDVHILEAAMKEMK